MDIFIRQEFYRLCNVVNGTLYCLLGSVKLRHEKKHTLYVYSFLHLPVNACDDLLIKILGI